MTKARVFDTLITKAITYREVDAVYNLTGGKVQFSMSGGTIINWSDNSVTKPSNSAIAAEVTRLNNAEPMRLLRLVRDEKLAETDWWSVSDLTMSNDRKTYRQALRDLPSSADPKLDSDNFLTNVTWPTKPS